MGWKSFEKEKRLIRTNGPLQLGGMKFPFQEEAKSLWSDPPLMDNKFAGCIKNFTHNGQLYNLGQPSDSVNAMSDCQFSLKQAVTLGRDSLVAILVCIAVMIGKTVYGINFVEVLCHRLLKNVLFFNL